MGVRQLKSGNTLDKILQEMRNIAQKKNPQTNKGIGLNHYRMMFSFRSKIFIEQNLRATNLSPLPRKH